MPMETPKQWAEWIVFYRRRFLGPGENADFVDAWKSDLIAFDFEDAAGAIEDLGRSGDQRANYPRQHLSMLLEFAAIRRDRRQQDAQIAEYRKLQTEHGKAKR